MSVNSSYYSLDWRRTPYIQENGNFDFLFDYLEKGELPEWIEEVCFGKQTDPYMFSSWSGFMSFSDWFEEARSKMNPNLVAQFSSLYLDMGLLFDSDYALSPIKKDIVFDDEWLLGAIPPEQVEALFVRSCQIDISILTSEFQKALNREPLDLLATGESVRDWLFALRDGLGDVQKKGFGIIIGAA
jgi:hypothetical protein